MPGGGEIFCAQAADRLAGLPGVRAVSLGGSRAAGTARPDSDWDFAVYYRGATFDPASLRALGWPGEIFPIGGWGGGVFNGGAWLHAGGRRVDVHYRDLEDVEHHLAEAQAGRFGIERLLFHLAGVPSGPAGMRVRLQQSREPAFTIPPWSAITTHQPGLLSVNMVAPPR